MCGLSYAEARRRAVAYHHAAAGGYDRQFLVRRHSRLQLKVFVSLMPPLPRDSLALDFGCGTGRQTLELAARGFRVDAYDAAPGMRDVLRRKLAAMPAGPRVRLLESEEEIAERRYPLVVCIGLLDYYPDPRPLLERIVRPLARTGHLLVSFPDAASPLAWLYWLGCQLACPSHLHALRAVRRVAARLGLRIAATRRSPVDSALTGMLTFVRFERI